MTFHSAVLQSPAAIERMEYNIAEEKHERWRRSFFTVDNRVKPLAHKTRTAELKKGIDDSFDLNKAAAILESVLQPQWVKTSERLPEAKGNFFIAHEGSTSEAIYLGDGLWWLVGTDGSGNVIELKEQVTHWMPLPAPPTEEKTI